MINDPFSPGVILAKRVANRFRMLLAQKATKQQQNIALMDVQRETGIAWSTLNA